MAHRPLTARYYLANVHVKCTSIYAYQYTSNITGYVFKVRFSLRIYLQNWFIRIISDEWPWPCLLSLFKPYLSICWAKRLQIFTRFCTRVQYTAYVIADNCTPAQIILLMMTFLDSLSNVVSPSHICKQVLFYGTKTANCISIKFLVLVRALHLWFFLDIVHCLFWGYG